MANPDSPRPIALITGASSGLGKSYATQLARNGYDLVVVARRRERLEQLAGEVRSDHGASTEVLTADLTKPDGFAQVRSRAGNGDLDMVVNNAGVAGYRPFLELDPDAADDLVRLHVRAVTLLTRAALPAMVQRRGGAIINVSSLLSLSGSIPPNPLPYRATYAGAKAFILTFTRALAGELKDTGVRLQVCLPGVVATEFHEHLNLDRSRIAALAMQPDEVVAASLLALERDELICVPGLEDPGLIEDLALAERAVMQAGNRPQLSSRYQASRLQRR